MVKLCFENEDGHSYDLLSISLKSHKLQGLRGAYATLKKAYEEANYFLRLLDRVRDARKDSRNEDPEFEALLSIRCEKKEHELLEFLCKLSPPVFLRVISYISQKELQKLGKDLSLFGAECEAVLKAEVDKTKKEADDSVLLKAFRKNEKFKEEWKGYLKSTESPAPPSPEISGDETHPPPSPDTSGDRSTHPPLSKRLRTEQAPDAQRVPQIPQLSGAQSCGRHVYDAQEPPATMQLNHVLLPQLVDPTSGNGKFGSHQRTGKS